MIDSQEIAQEIAETVWLDSFESRSEKYTLIAEVLRLVANQIIEEVSPVEALFEIANKLEKMR